MKPATAPIGPDEVCVVLYGRAGLDRDQHVASIAARMNAGGGGPFFAAYEDLTGPSLPDVLDDLVARGAQQVLVAPCAVPADPSLGTWLAGALSAWRIESGATLDLRLAPPVEQFIDIDEALRAAIAVEPERLKPVADVTPSMGKPGWTDVPEHGRHVFFCVGARCAHRRAMPLYQHLRKLLKAERALVKGPQRVLCARSSCLFPCNQGPLMVVHPEGVWYGDFDEAMLERIVREHFVENRVVEDAVVHRQGPAPGSGSA